MEESQTTDLAEENQASRKKTKEVSMPKKVKRKNGSESITTRFGGRRVESEIRTEHLSSTLAIVRIVRR